MQMEWATTYTTIWGGCLYLYDQTDRPESFSTMKKPLITSCFLLFILSGLNAQVDFTDSNLPIVVINTFGQDIIDEEKITCEMGIINNGLGMRNYLTDPYNDYFGDIGIELRGSTSQQYPKKSYGVETRDSLGFKLNTSILGMPSENDWILYGAYPDKSLMRNEITFSIFSRMQPWSPRYVYCELMLNGSYRGVYTFIERIKRDDNRIAIATLDSDDIAGDSLTGGYIFKIDKLTGSSVTTWTSPYQDKLLYLYHDPEDIELTIEQSDYIKNYVTAFENAVYGPDFSDPEIGFRKYIDISTFVDFFLMQELGRTVDGYRSSSFMYKDKDSNGGKLKCGPMWDFNLSYGNADYCDAFDTTGWQYNFATVCPDFPTEPPHWWPVLLEDIGYRRLVKCRWDALRSSILHTDSINAWIDSVAAYLEESQDRNFEKWDILGTYVNWNYFVGDTYAEEIEYLKGWFKARSEWLDNNLPNIVGDCGIKPYDFEEPVVGVDEMEISQILIFPNPFNTSATFEFSSLSSENRVLLIYTVIGDLVKQINVPANISSITVTAENLSTGVYLFRLVDNTDTLTTGAFEIN